MTLAANITPDGWLWYEPERVDAPHPGLFDPDAWRDEARVEPVDRGRGAAWFIDVSPERRYVLRTYRRGGLVGRVIDDWYLYTGTRRTRPAREIRLLERLEELDLPAPRPVAARYRRRGLIYRADILTERLPDTRPLSAVLLEGPLPGYRWRAIGRCIRAFHDRGVFHADLNAHNVLLDGNDRVYLIDFDRGAIREHGRWQQDNLARLARSLKKLAAESPFHYGAADWQSLLAGYGSLRP